MIGKVSGKLVQVDNSLGLIETRSGLTYEVFITPKIISDIKIGQALNIFTYLQVRDDALVLFGFESKPAHDFFKLLLTVPGVGPKTAFSVISFCEIDELVAAVRNNNLDYFTKIPGLGKKTSLKIILEISQKIRSDFKFQNLYLSEDDTTVVEALVSLGYKSQEARKILSTLPKNLTIEEKIQKALKTK